jgi:dihydrofolate synthase/folylpolyglutamate synthase
MAFDFFAKEKVDIAIIEVGLGGRLDSTNIITPELSVITNISLDHTNILGDTLQEIAFEKAGIIKNSIPVIIGEQQAKSSTVFLKTAKTNQAEIIFAESALTINKVIKKNNKLKFNIFKNEELIFKDLKADLTGTYQLKNIKTVIQSVLTLREKGFKIPDEAIYKALKNVKKITGLQGRWQTLSKKPLVICDTGHNKAGLTEVLKNIANTPHQNLHIVMGMVKDKDIDGVLALLPQKASYYFCAPALERALPAPDLAQKAGKFNLNGQIYKSVKSALRQAKENAKSNDLIFVGGSTFVVAEIL